MDLGPHHSCPCGVAVINPESKKGPLEPSLLFLEVMVLCDMFCMISLSRKECPEERGLGFSSKCELIREDFMAL